MIGKIISHYKIIEKIGEGGMGIVYKAEDIKLDRTVALKFLPQHLTTTDTERARFLQEAKAAAALNHPNVCVIHEIQDTNDEPFIVMEYIDGKTIRSPCPLMRPLNTPSKLPRRSKKPTATASCTATSNPKISCSTPKTRLR